PGASQDRDSGHRGGALRDQRAISVAVASIPEAKNFVVQSLCDLVATMAGGAPAPPPATVPPAGSIDPGTPPTGDGGVAGTLVAGPDVVERMRTLEVVWRGGTLGRDRPVDDPFLLLERQQPDGGWTVADTDLGWAFVWREHDGEYRARYDVAHDFPIGTYRVRIQSARYTLATASFAIASSSGLRVRGATAARMGESTRLDFVAQNPPPDPEQSILSRPHEPEGGSLRFELGGRQGIAPLGPGATDLERGRVRRRDHGDGARRAGRAPRRARQRLARSAPDRLRRRPARPARLAAEHRPRR